MSEGLYIKDNNIVSKTKEELIVWLIAFQIYQTLKGFSFTVS